MMIRSAFFLTPALFHLLPYVSSQTYVCVNDSPVGQLNSQKQFVPGRVFLGRAPEAASGYCQCQNQKLSCPEPPQSKLLSGVTKVTCGPYPDRCTPKPAPVTKTYVCVNNSPVGQLNGRNQFVPSSATPGTPQEPSSGYCQCRNEKLSCPEPPQSKRLSGVAQVTCGPYPDRCTAKPASDPRTQVCVNGSLVGALNAQRKFVPMQVTPGGPQESASGDCQCEYNKLRCVEFPRSQALSGVSKVTCGPWSGRCPA